jgi:hypothetical protein
MANNRLNPPQIETSLPPMIVDFQSGDACLKIPLYSNPSVAIGDINGISIIIKTVSTGVEKE